MPKQGAARRKEKPASSKKPVGAHVKLRATSGKRTVAIRDEARADMGTEHEEVNMATELTGTGEPLEATGETVESATAARSESIHIAPSTRAAETAELAEETTGEVLEMTNADEKTAASGIAAGTGLADTPPATEKTAPGSGQGSAEAETPIISAYTGSSLARKPEPPRFNIFIIDTGWNPDATRILHQNLPLIRELNPSDGTFLLDRDRSVSVLRRHHALIGRDPIISVHDLDVMGKDSPQGGGSPSGVHGFRLHLGLVRTEEKIKDALEMFLRFLRRHRDSRHLEKDVREKLRKEGIAGTIEIMGHGVELFRG